MNKIEELKAAYEAATQQCPDTEQPHLTHDDMKGRTLPCTVFLADVYADDPEDMHVSELTVLRYDVVEGASVPTLLVEYSNGSKARMSIESFHATRESAQAEVDAAKCYVCKVDGQQRFEELALELMPVLLQTVEQVRQLEKAMDIIANSDGDYTQNIVNDALYESGYYSYDEEI